MPDLVNLLKAPDLFVLFGLERRFDLDVGRLQSQFAQLSDIAAAAAATDPDAAEALKGRLTEGRRVLLDPQSRADYLLTLLGGPEDGQVPDMPGGFLDSLDLLKQGLASARATADPSAISSARQQVQNERAAHLQRIGDLLNALRGGDNPVVRRDRMRAVRAELNALRALSDLNAPA